MHPHLAACQDCLTRIGWSMCHRLLLQQGGSCSWVQRCQAGNVHVGGLL